MKKFNTFLGIFFVLLCFAGGITNEKYFLISTIITAIAVIIGVYFLVMFFKKHDLGLISYVGLGLVVFLFVGLFVIQIL